MKSTAITISSILVAAAAFALVSASAAAAGIAFTVVGFLSVFVADYGWRINARCSEARRI